MEIFGTVISGVLVFVLGQILIRFVVEPIQKLKRVIGNISHTLICYADIYSNPGLTRRVIVAEARKALRDRASLLRSQAAVIPFYKALSWLRLVPSRQDIQEASKGLIGLSNSLSAGNPEHNDRRREIVTKSLQLDNDDHPPTVGERQVNFAFRTFIRFIPVVITFEAAIFLAKGNLFLSAENIALLTATRIGYNPQLVTSLAQQSADTDVGVILLLVSLVLQIWSAFWSVRIGDMGQIKVASFWRWCFLLCWESLLS